MFAVKICAPKFTGLGFRVRIKRYIGVIEGFMGLYGVEGLGFPKWGVPFRGSDYNIFVSILGPPVLRGKLGNYDVIGCKVVGEIRACTRAREPDCEGRCWHTACNVQTADFNARHC